MGEAVQAELKRIRERDAEAQKREEERIEESHRLTAAERERYEGSDQGLVARQIRQAEEDMKQTPAPDRGGFGDHDGDQFAEVPEPVKPPGAPSAKEDGSDPGDALPAGAPADPTKPAVDEKSSSSKK